MRQPTLLQLIGDASAVLGGPQRFCTVVPLFVGGTAGTLVYTPHSVLLTEALSSVQSW